MNAAAAMSCACLRISTPHKQLFLLHPPQEPRTSPSASATAEGGLMAVGLPNDGGHSGRLFFEIGQIRYAIGISPERKLSRLLKADTLNALTELQRQNELDLALEVFKLVKKETWFEADPSLYSDMIRLLGKNKKFDMAEELLLEIRKDGGEPDTRAYTEMIGVYCRADMVEKAVELYEMMKASGFSPGKLTLTIMIRNLETAGEDALATTVKRECFKYIEYPRKFLAEFGRKYPKRRSLDLR